jgi:hypothetical protein
MITKTINLAKDFHRAPAGRFLDDGDYSGQRFREEYLVPALQDQNVDQVEIILDDLEGIGSSFWEEAFGGLIRESKIGYDTILKKLSFQCQDDDTLKPLILGYINRASKQK